MIAWGWSPWSDLLRVDILNTIGLSMMLMGVVCWIVLKLSSGIARHGRPWESTAPVALLC